MASLTIKEDTLLVSIVKSDSSSISKRCVGLVAVIAVGDGDAVAVDDEIMPLGRARPE
ncbi:hypothetical protein T12_15929 [Trichinella patagoniensis]|uniref:Uncharacterized protein n=1 Tax=Trichinella patagoniensis TaxID=990121 RepID=A0A0V0ZQI1_9BILA|nr:hypothetical protein T12_15929 [Trichinella patagoniensis]